MKKHLICILLALCLGIFAGCGSKSAQEGAAPSAPAQQDGVTAAADVFAFPVKGGTVAINEDMADALALLGEPQSYFEAPSCAFEGLDKTYTYAGFVIETYPREDGHDIINHILLTDDSVTTQEKLFIGSSEADVVALYGESEGDMPNYLTYTRGDASLSFLIENGVVVSIEYLPA